MRCKNCGNENNENAKYCNKCGEKLVFETYNKERDNKKLIIVPAVIILLLIVVILVVIVLKNQKKNTVTFKNIKPGVYYLKAHAYTLLNGIKQFGVWSDNKKVVVK